MNLGPVLRRSSFAALLLLSGCGSSDDGGGLLGSDPVEPVEPTLTISGPDSVASGTSSAYTVTALDSDGEPVSGVSVTLSTSLGTLSRATTSTTTDADGELPFTLSATKTSDSGAVSPVTGTASVVAKGSIDDTAVSDTLAVEMTPTIFKFTSPVANTRVALNTLQPLVLQWASDGIAVSAPVTFAAKLGTLVDAAGNAGSSLTVSTDGSGIARLQVVSGTAGTETITATDDSGDFDATLTLIYVGEASAFTATAASPIAASGGASTITAKVTDASGGAVTGATVTFAIGSAPAAGTLAPATVTTNASGIATAIYRANGAAGTATITVTVGALAAKTVTITING
jgi:hypothetical protein